MRVRKITDVIGTKVYTDLGDFFGEVGEANLCENKIDGWRIKITSNLVSLFNGSKGVIIPHSFVKAMGDVFIIDKCAMPSADSELEDLHEDLI